MTGRTMTADHSISAGSNQAFTTTFYHGDHLGSSRMSSGADGYPTWQNTYYPWGGGYNPQSTVTHYKFTGQERDGESGLDNFGARYYSNVTGRFMTPDWSLSPEPVPYADLSDPQSLNLYSYVRNNPISRADLDGHCDVCWEIAIRVAQYIAVHAASTGTGINATRQEYVKRAGQATTRAERDALKVEMRGKGPALGRAPDHAANDPSRTAARAAKTEAQLAESIGRTSGAATGTAEALGAAGRVAGVAAVGFSAYNVATAPEGEKGRVAAGEAGGLTGSWAGGEVGAEAGAAIGSMIAPVLGTIIGAGIGGAIGAVGGGYVGHDVGTQVYDDTTKAEQKPRRNSDAAQPPPKQAGTK